MSTVKDFEKNIKDTEGKPRWNLINLKGIEGIVKVREFGDIKYTNSKGWRKVDPIDWVNAIKRHLTEMDEKGIFSCDDESGLPHIWHIGCNFFFLSMKYYWRDNESS